MYVVSKRDLHIFLDPDTKEPYEAESYILTNRQRITWDHKSQSWRDRHGKEYTPVTMGKIVGFNRKNTLSEIDKQLLSITPEGRAYVEYNERIGGEVIGLEEPWGYPPCISEYLEQGHTLEDALITGVKAIIAEEYSRNLSKKLNNSNKRRIERALNGEEVSAMGNGKSLAFKIVNGKWVKDEEEAKLGKKIFELYLEYDSIRKVRDWVNEHGYTNSVGKPFTSESISRILKNEKAKGVIVMGKYHHDFDKKKIVRRSEEELVRIPAPELAYVSEEVFDKVQERLRAKTGNGRGVNAYSDPLSGKIYCGSCGRKLWKHASNGYVNWMCASQVAKGDVECNGTRITTVAIRNIYKKITDNLEVNKGVVKQDIVKWLNELKATLSDSSVNEKIQKDLDKLERKRTKLLEAYLEDFISKDDYKAKYEAIEGQIEEKKKLLVPVEENEDIKVIESVLQNIDDEIDAYVKTLDMEESKVDFLIEHTKRITVLENRDIIIELDLVAGAIIAGKDFLLYVHDTMPLTDV